jgi:radical SAM superfamily enzyme YgiQ (UPF0313 family)
VKTRLIADLGLHGSGRLSAGVARNTLRVTLARPLINRDANSPFFLPLGLLCVASPLQARGHRVTIIDNEFGYRTGRLATIDGPRWLDEAVAPILASKPQVVGMTVLADTLPTALLMGRRIKQEAPGTAVVLGGPGTFGSFPKLLAGYADAVDFVCQAEGELALVDLVEAVAEGGDPHAVRGFWSLRDGAPHNGGPALPTDLDHIPMPAYDALPIDEYLELSSPRIFDMHIGSGCTYSCKFCMTSTFWNRDFRVKSPEVVLRELDSLHERYGITRVNFLHDNFANKRVYLEGFIDYFTEHNTRYEWGCAVRPDNVTESLLRRMREAGCFSVFCGTDAGSEKILRSMAKMPGSKRIYQFFEGCLTTGMTFETNTIIGYPDEDPDDLEASLEVIFDAIAHGAANSDLSILQPLPGAEVTQENLDRLVTVEQQMLGTFLPPEAQAMVSGDPADFPGFHFIGKGNQPYQYYVEVLRLTRFFTRRYYLFLRYLKQRCGTRYVDVFDRLAGVAPEAIPDALPGLLAGLPQAEHDAASALLGYEAAVLSLRPGELLAELDNVYLEPDARTGARYELLDLPIDVVRMFDDPVRLAVPEDARRPTVYLMYVSPAGEIRTLRLQRWHAALLRNLELGGVDEYEAAFELAAATGCSPDDAMDRVCRALDQLRVIVGTRSREPVMAYGIR